MLLICVLFFDPTVNQIQQYECTADLAYAQEQVSVLSEHGQLAWLESEGV